METWNNMKVHTHAVVNFRFISIFILYDSMQKVGKIIKHENINLYKFGSKMFIVKSRK